MSSRQACSLTLTIAALLIGALPTNCPASDSDSETENSLKRGKYALLFEIDDDFDLKSFEGSTLSLKKHTSPKSAYRIGLSLSFSLNDREDSSFFSDSVVTDSLFNQSNSDFDRYGIGLTLHRLFYTNPGSSTSLFIGLGPSVNFDHQQSKSTIRSLTDPSTRFSQSESTTWDLGLSFTMGVEWFVHRNVGILGEYGLAISYQQRETTSSTTYEPPTRSTRRSVSESSFFSLRSRNGRVGLSIYF